MTKQLQQLYPLVHAAIQRLGYAFQCTDDRWYWIGQRDPIQAKDLLAIEAALASRSRLKTRSATLRRLADDLARVDLDDPKPEMDAEVAS